MKIGSRMREESSRAAFRDGHDPKNGGSGFRSGQPGLSRPPALLFKSNRPGACESVRARRQNATGRAFALPIRCPGRLRSFRTGHVPLIFWFEPGILASLALVVWFGADPISVTAVAKRKLPLTITRAPRVLAPATTAARVLHLLPVTRIAGRYLSRIGTESRGHAARHGTAIDMRQASTRDLFGYWDALRGAARRRTAATSIPVKSVPACRTRSVLDLRRRARPSLPDRRNFGLRVVRVRIARHAVYGSGPPTAARSDDQLVQRHGESRREWSRA